MKNGKAQWCTCVVEVVTLRARPRCLGVNKHIDLGLCLFLTVVREMTELPDTSTAIGGTCVVGFVHGPRCSGFTMQMAARRPNSQTQVGPMGYSCLLVRFPREVFRCLQAD